MKNHKKIGWQKYEDYVEKQLTSPTLNNLLHNIAAQSKMDAEDDETVLDEDEDEEDYVDDIESQKKTSMLTPFIPLTNKFVDDILMLSTFDCWIGHTNFDITPQIKNTLNSIPGIEILKICSRYRFFIGVGKMFDFKNVRQYIEEALIEGE